MGAPTGPTAVKIDGERPGHLHPDTQAPDTQARPETMDSRHRFVRRHATPRRRPSARFRRKQTQRKVKHSMTGGAPQIWWSDHTQGSRLLHRLGEATSKPAFGIIVAVAVIAWGLLGMGTGFPLWWQLTLYSSSSIVTLIMVFVIQHTQTHQQKATQRKLDEILRALPAADDRLISAEHAPDAELDALTALNLSDRLRVAEQ